jgi:hypothetical protein
LGADYSELVQRLRDIARLREPANDPASRGVQGEGADGGGNLERTPPLVRYGPRAIRFQAVRRTKLTVAAPERCDGQGVLEIPERGRNQSPPRAFHMHISGRRAAHSSRFFRFPQGVSLQSGLNSRTTWRFSALADARHHGRAVMFDDQEQRFNCSLPFLELLFGLR